MSIIIVGGRRGNILIDSYLSVYIVSVIKISVNTLLVGSRGRDSSKKV